MALVNKRKITFGKKTHSSQEVEINQVPMTDGQMDGETRSASHTEWRIRLPGKSEPVRARMELEDVLWHDMS